MARGSRSTCGETQPEFILLQCGADSLEGDPITHLAFSEEAHAYAAAAVCRIADELGHGRVLAMGGGGYNRQNLARAWTRVVEALVAARRRARCAVASAFDGFGASTEQSARRRPASGSLAGTREPIPGAPAAASMPRTARPATRNPTRRRLTIATRGASAGLDTSQGSRRQTSHALRRDGVASARAG